MSQSSPAGVLVEAAKDAAVPDITLLPGNGPSGISSITYTQEAAFAFEGSPPATLIAPLGLAVRAGVTQVLDANKSAGVHTGVIRQYGQDGKFQGKFGDYTWFLGRSIMKDNVQAIAIDQQGRTLVLDENKKLWRFSTDGDKDKAIDVNVDGTDDMAVDPTSGNIYVAGGGITKLNAEGETPQKLSAAGNVSAIAVAKDCLWGVVDNKVQKMGLDGSMQIEFGASGIDHPDTFQQATDVAVDQRNGNVVVADKGTKQVYVYDTAGVMIGKVGAGVFDAPQAVAVDKDGRVFVLDAGKKKVYKFLPTMVK
jgi:DNA-binding beta-propeller fold protein YncE